MAVTEQQVFIYSSSSELESACRRINRHLIGSPTRKKHTPNRNASPQRPTVSYRMSEKTTVTTETLQLLRPFRIAQDTATW